MWIKHFEAFSSQVISVFILTKWSSKFVFYVSNKICFPIRVFTEIVHKMIARRFQNTKLYFMALARLVEICTPKFSLAKSLSLQSFGEEYYPEIHSGVLPPASQVLVFLTWLLWLDVCDLQPLKPWTWG